MSEIQTGGARKLLRIISSVNKTSKSLTYSETAVLLGRPKNHSRAIAQMCDLLDAAACLAGVPLLALVAVREKSGEVNPKAWKEFGDRREAIIRRSTNHQFGASDFQEISSALDDLGGKGNRRAWSYVHRLYPGDLLYKRLIGDYVIDDAIDDLGIDSPDRAKSEVWSYARDPKVRAAVLERAKGRCEFCTELGFLKPDGSRYLESHHIIALAKDGADKKTNVIALCPNDHRAAHFGQQAEVMEKLMVTKLKSINS